MKRFAALLAPATLIIILASTTFAGTIVGARISRTGTIVGARSGNIVGARTGNITGARTGNIAGTSVVPDGSRQGLETLLSENFVGLVRLLIYSPIF